jgi:hypothetical protein
MPYPTCHSSQSSPWLSGNELVWGSQGCRFIPSLCNISDIGMDSDIDVGLCRYRTVPTSEWQFSVRHIVFRYRNNTFRCRILPTLRSMSIPTLATYVKLKVKTPDISMVQCPYGSVTRFLLNAQQTVTTLPYRFRAILKSAFWIRKIIWIRILGFVFWFVYGPEFHSSFSDYLQKHVFNYSILLMSN